MESSFKDSKMPAKASGPAIPDCGFQSPQSALSSLHLGYQFSQ
jgi:hypothetical protein